jgi:hypothetical protein
MATALKRLRCQGSRFDECRQNEIEPRAELVRKNTCLKRRATRHKHWLTRVQAW